MCYRKSTAETSIMALTWSSLLVEHALPKCVDVGKPEFQKLVEAQSMLLSAATAAGIKKYDRNNNLLYIIVILMLNRC